MYKLVRLVLVVWVALFAFASVARPTVAAAAAPTCTAGFTIASTTPGTVTTKGQYIFTRDSGVGGRFTSGFLDGYTFKGTQGFVIDTTTNKAQLLGSFTATGPGGTLTLPYTVNADLTTGAGSGYFFSTTGTGQFANFQWRGSITAQIINPSPTTFVVTATGPCSPTP